MKIKCRHLQGAKHFAAFVGIFCLLIGYANGADWQFAGLTEDLNHEYFYRKTSGEASKIQRIVIVAVTLRELDRGKKVFAKEISTLRASREASNYVPQYFVTSVTEATDPESNAQRSLAKSMSNDEIIVGFLDPSSYEKSEVEVDCERDLVRIVKSDSKTAESRLNPIKPKKPKDWVNVGAFSPLLWPQKAVCSTASPPVKR